MLELTGASGGLFCSSGIATLEEANEAARERVEEECVFAAFPGRFRRDESINALGGFECECQVSAASAVEGVRARFTVSVNAVECAAEKAAQVAALARVEDPRRVLKRNPKGFKMLLPYGKPQGLRRGPLCAKSEQASPPFPSLPDDVVFGRGEEKKERRNAGLTIASSFALPHSHVLWRAGDHRAARRSSCDGSLRR